MDQKLFAASTVAERSTTNPDTGTFTTQIKLFTLYVAAHSEAEAIGLMFQKIREDLPPSDGWYNHFAEALEIPADVLAKFTP